MRYKIQLGLISLSLIAYGILAFFNPVNALEDWTGINNTTTWAFHDNFADNTIWNCIESPADFRFNAVKLPLAVATGLTNDFYISLSNAKASTTSTFLYEPDLTTIVSTGNIKTTASSTVLNFYNLTAPIDIQQNEYICYGITTTRTSEGQGTIGMQSTFQLIPSNWTGNISFLDTWYCHPSSGYCEEWEHTNFYPYAIAFSETSIDSVFTFDFPVSNGTTYPNGVIGGNCSEEVELYMYQYLLSATSTPRTITVACDSGTWDYVPVPPLRTGQWLAQATHGSDQILRMFYVLADETTESYEHFLNDLGLSPTSTA